MSLAIPLSGLYVITDASLAPGRDHLSVAAAALRSGVRLIQFRPRGMNMRTALEDARSLRRMTREREALLIINDHCDLCLAVDADGVHLGQEDMPIPVARRLMGPSIVIGGSVDTNEEARRAAADGADYVSLGPIYATTTKRDAGPVVGPAGLRQVVAECPVPVAAIGGIGADNIGEVVQTGCAMVCVISAVVCAADMVEAVQSLQSLLQPCPR